jgi:diguanylate cyclase (GGDEF)-like protein
VTLPPGPTVRSVIVVRLAMTGMALAVLALGALAVWSAYLTQRGADQLAGVGVQTTGQLRAVQSLSAMRIELTSLEDDGVTDAKLARLDAAQRLLAEALARMESGDAPEPALVARKAWPLQKRLGPAIDRYLTDPRGDILYKGEFDDDTTEDALEAVMEELDVLLADASSDPADLLGGRLANVTSTAVAVRRTALVLIPLGLGGVLVCARLLRVYRRRSQDAMRVALERSAREARTDQLTGLPNRRALMEELDRRIAAGQTFTLALADLNGFKRYNDSFGHPAGDALLRRLGHRLAEAWDGHGFAARLGGDEFCVIADALEPDALQGRLHAALRETGDGVNVSAASGLAAVPVDATDASSALRLADTRLYAAKADIHGRAVARSASTLVR